MMLLVQMRTRRVTIILRMTVEAQAVRAQAVVAPVLAPLPPTTTGGATESIGAYKSAHVGHGRSQTISAYSRTRVRWV